MTRHENILKVMLRVIGSVACLAFFCMVMPYSWMNAVHEWLGMGTLPAEPVVGYLARSTCAFYGMLGGLLWVVSFDLRRHRLVLCYIGGVITFFFGLALFVVDLLEGMPLFWTIGEGPFNAVFGVVILYLSYRIEPQASAGDQNADT